MKISTNMIGNYTPHKIGGQTAQAVSKTHAAAVPDKVTTDEKQFFTALYPDNKEEILKHHFYDNRGRMSGVAVGSVFDRRG